MFVTVIQFITLVAAIAGGALYALGMRGPKRLRGLLPGTLWVVFWPVLPMLLAEGYNGSTTVALIVIVGGQVFAGALGASMGLLGMRTHLERVLGEDRSLGEP